MDVSQTPQIEFPEEDPSPAITFNAAASEWINNTTYIAKYDVATGIIEYIEDVDTRIQSASDLAGNPMIVLDEIDFFDISVDWTTTDISEVQSGQGVLVFPNPINSGDQLNIELENADQFAVRVYSLEGKEMSVNVLDSSNQKMLLSTSGWSAGVYAVHLSNGSEQTVLRVIVN